MYLLNEALQQQLIENSTDCIKILDPQGRLLYINPGGLRAMEIADFSSRVNMVWTELWQEEDRPQALQAVSTAKAGGAGTFQASRLGDDDMLRWWDVVVTPLLVNQGEAEHLLVVARDITAQKQAEEALLLLEVERKRVEQERELLLREKMDLLESAGERKDLFISIASHELRTPVTTIKASLQIAERRIKRLLDPSVVLPPEMSGAIHDISHLLSRALRQIEIQNRLINDLLDASRIQVDKLHIMPRACDLVKIVCDVVEDQRHASPMRRISLEIAADEPVLVYADADRIGQVVSNYLINALKYSPVTQPVEVGLTLEERDVRVWVRDYGAGLSLEAQKRIWHRFYQEEGSTGQWGAGGVGLGLGLHICQTLITRHHGTVGVDSAPGQGACFWFTLPLVEE